MRVPAEAHEPVRHLEPSKQRVPTLSEITSMFKKLVPVVALALIAGPVLAADPPAGGDSATPATKSHKHSGKHHSKKNGGTKSTDTSNAPAK
jgi:hypothetical protein